MATKSKAAPETDKTADLMKAMTDSMIKLLEAGLADPKGWVAPWHQASYGTATNVLTHKRYRGGNLLWLSLLEMDGEHQGPVGTFRQWMEVGAHVRKGEKGTVILAPLPVSFKEVDAKTGVEKTRSFVRFRAHYVFFASQVDGWERPVIPEIPESERIASADAWLARVGKHITIKHDVEGQAYYVPAMDVVHVPPFGHFKTPAGYYGTTLHELTHATGHVSRLDRNEMHPVFGSPEYAMGELVAELGAAALGQLLGVTTAMPANTEKYLANWIHTLKNDPAALWQAASHAEKAVGWLMEAGAEAVAEQKEAA